MLVPIAGQLIRNPSPVRDLSAERHGIDYLVDRVLGEVGLAGDKAKMPSELSGGMRKRAGLARAPVLELEIGDFWSAPSVTKRHNASEVSPNHPTVVTFAGVHTAKQTAADAALLV